MCPSNNSSKYFNLLSVPEEIILRIVGYLNQFDVINIRCLNKKLGRIGAIKLFNSIYVYLPELTTVEEGLAKSKSTYWSFRIKYTYVNGRNSFEKIFDLEQLRLVRNVVLSIKNPNENSDACYSYLVQNCPWITVDVCSTHPDMFYKQFSRLDKISQLRVQNDFLFNYDINDNCSIKELYITDSLLKLSDSFALIPKLKGLTLLYISDSFVKDILEHFNRWNISGLKLKTLALRIPELSLERLEEVFVLDEIVSFELQFYNKIEPYDGLKWLCSQMKKLRCIHISWYNMSFQKVMDQFLGLQLLQIKLENYGGEEKEISGPEIEQLLSGHDSVIRFGISMGFISAGVVHNGSMLRGTPKSAQTFRNLASNFNIQKYPKIQIVDINNSACFM
ncbi:hypothetical protein JA1_002269 [Spathaspora sp. JA1]|nr:hypothetical protein JA1_002269 [Spathaspora sp. JA1]